MEYRDFVEQVKEQIQDFLPEKFADAAVEVNQIVKNNDCVLDGLMVRTEESNIAPTIYLNPYFEQIQDGAELDDVLAQIASVYQSHYIDHDIDVSAVTDFDKIKEKIVCKLINEEANQQFLQDKPYSKLEDLAVVYQILMDKTGEGTATITITDNLMDGYGITLEELHDQALQNMDTLQPHSFKGMNETVAEMIAVDIASDMEYLKEWSFLEELDELNVEIRIRETLADSIAYTVLKRCGMEESELAEEINFPYIHEFNTVETLSQLGSNVSDLSKPILMEIGKAIGAYDRQIAQNREETRVGRERIDTHEKNIEKGLANASEADYNALKRESESQDEQSITQTGEAGERSKYDESDIREERGLSDTDGSNGRTAEGGTDKVRTDEEEVLTGAQERSIYGTSSEREAEGTLVDDTGAGRGENGASDQTDEGERGDNGADESRESDALGSEDEQHRTLGRGDRDDGTNLQLNIEQPEGTYQQLSLFPSFEEQVGTMCISKSLLPRPIWNN